MTSGESSLSASSGLPNAPALSGRRWRVAAGRGASCRSAQAACSADRHTR